VLRLRLQTKNLSLHGTRVQLVARLQGKVPPTAPRNKGKKRGKKGNPKAQKGTKRTRPNTEDVCDISEGTESEPEEPPQEIGSFTSEQLAVIQSTVQASLAAWQPTSPWPTAPLGDSMLQSTPGTSKPIGLDRPLEESLQEKVIKGEYIDLSLLLPDSLQSSDPYYHFGVDESIPGSSVKLIRKRKTPD
jgi:hypothetical protein